MTYLVHSTDQDSLWQSYDLGSFGYDPDLSFNLGVGDPNLPGPLVQDNVR